MATKELVFKLKFVDENGAIVEKTAESINDINKSIKDLRNELENTELGSEQWNNLVSDLGEAENALDKTTEAINDAKNAQKGLGDQLTSAPGVIGQVSNSVKGLGKTFKALLANPIVLVIAAIVAGLTALYKAFTSTKKGGELMEQVFAGISAVMDVLRDRILKIGGAIIKFFKGDFSGAADDLKGAFSGIGAEIASEFQEAMRIKAELQAIEDATRELNNERARQNTEIAKSKLLINDETKSYEEREKALQEVRQAEIALAKQEEILAQRRYDAIKAQNALSDSSKEALDAEAQAYQQLQAAQLASLQKQKELYDQEKALRDRRRAEQKAAYEKRKQELESLADIEFNLNQALELDATQKALNDIERNKEKLEQQIKDLKASKERERELILKLEESTQREREKIITESYTTQLAKLNEFTQRLIDLQKSRDIELLEGTEERLRSELDVLQQQIFDADKYEEFRNLLLANRYEEAYKLQEDYLDERKKANENASETYYNNLVDLTQATQAYYNTLKFEAEQKLKADIVAFNATKEEEIKAQKDTAKQVRDIRLKQRRAQMEEDLQDEKLTAEQRLEVMKQASLDAIQIHKEYQASIQATDEYFEDFEKNRIEQFNQEKATLLQQANQRLIDIQREYNEKNSELQQQDIDAQIARFNLLGSAISALNGMLGDDFAFKKEIAAAETLFGTYQAAQQAYLSQIAIPTLDAPIRAQIAAGIAIASGLARVASIYKVEEPQAADGMIVGQGSGRMDNIGVKVSNGESIINARSTRMFGGLLSAINQAGGGKRFATGGITGLSTQTSPETNLLNQLVGTNKSPMKTYVVSSDVSSNQSLDRQIKSRSIL